MTSEGKFPFCLESPSGLLLQINENGSIHRFDHGDILLNSFLGNELEGGPANLYLRRHTDSIEPVPLLGPRSPGVASFETDRFTMQGEWNGIAFTLLLVLDDTAPLWRWLVSLRNLTDQPITVDLIHAQDLSLAHYDAVRTNEYYVSQYVDYTPLVHPRCGRVLAVRQNLAVGGRNPWALLGSLRQGVSFATDALQLHGIAARAGHPLAGLRVTGLPGVRRQHEHSMAVIQGELLQILPGDETTGGFFGWFEQHHAGVSSPADLQSADRALDLPAPGKKAAVRISNASPTLFSARPELHSQELSGEDLAHLFGSEWRHIERDDEGQVLSFFAGAHSHVVTAAKERMVLRPHGHLLRSGNHLTPDETSLTSTVWMDGVFHSMVTQGHVNINRFLSTVRGYLGLQRSSGQRIFIELDDGFHLLGLPSAFEMTPNGCRWIYKYTGGLLEVCAWAPVDRHELNLSIRILEGEARRFLVSHHIALNGDDGVQAEPVSFRQDAQGVEIRPGIESDVSRRFPHGSFRIDGGTDTPLEKITGDEALFLDGRSRRLPYVCIEFDRTKNAFLRITGHLVESTPARVSPAIPAFDAQQDLTRAEPFWQGVTGPLQLHSSGGTDTSDAERLQELLPWLSHNALVHYLAPRGLEQFSGGGWGTRDVCQGPVEMLLALGRWEPLRDLLLRVFHQQNHDGDWPQWFMFFDRERNIRPGDSHGDIIFWPLLALAQYIEASEDRTILDVVVPYFHPEGDAKADTATVWEHVQRALGKIGERVIPGTHLAAYGHGDWNDSLQPADPTLSERLCSAWTVTLHHQMLTTLAGALRRIGRNRQAEALDGPAREVLQDFHRLLIVDGTIPGYVKFAEDGSTEAWLHPRDTTRGITYSLLPMIHAISNDLLTEEQAAAHVRILHKSLLGADGARLFDRPFPYHGGVQRFFQRAETSTFFGREIGIMYTHAHLRYAEAMAHYGDAEAFGLALRQANPIDLRKTVPSSRPRQANCYHSSSDADFADRYEASAQYDKVRSGEVAFEGGWRVYSSGAGIALRLVHECLLGIRRRRSALVIDPVIPRSFDGLQADIELSGRRVRVHYHRHIRGYGPKTILLNGDPLPFTRETNPYRTAGVRLAMPDLTSRLKPTGNLLRIELE